MIMNSVLFIIDFYNYRIARNFRGLKFSRMSLAQTFRDLIFEDWYTVIVDGWEQGGSDMLTCKR